MMRVSDQEKCRFIVLVLSLLLNYSENLPSREAFLNSRSGLNMLIWTYKCLDGIKKFF